jgi:tetratricopeptide (TPR) repeat protein
MPGPMPDQIPIPRGGADPGRLDPMARLVLSQVDGRASIAEIADASGIPNDLACRIVAALAIDGRVRLPGSDEDRGYADPEVAADAGDDAASADTDALEADVDRLSAEMGRMNYYELLRAEPNADRKELRSSYFVLSKRFHPDRAFGPRKEDLRKKMEIIFTRITRAYETLSSPESRAAYDAYIADQLELWKIERQLKDAVRLSENLGASAGTTPTPEPAAPQRPSAPNGVVTSSRSSAPARGAHRRAVVTSISPERRPPERAPSRPSLAPDDAGERRMQWKKERLGRALGMVLSRASDAPSARPSTRDLDERIGRAEMAIELGKSSDAVRLLQEALAERGDHPRARELLKRAEAGAMRELSVGYLRQARYERQHGDPELARANFEKAISADPSGLDARHQLAEMLIEHRLDLRKALQLCREVIGLGGQRAKYFVTLGEILLLSKDKERAVDAFERALALEPDNKDVKKKLKVCKG